MGFETHGTLQSGLVLYIPPELPGQHVYTAECLVTMTSLLSFIPGPVCMRQFKRLKTDNGDVRIVEESAERYKDIGTKLLTTVLVDSISEVANKDRQKAIRLIYKRWIRTDEGHSWRKLTQCFKDLELKSLAQVLEKHFGLPSLSGDDIR